MILSKRKFIGKTLSLLVFIFIVSTRSFAQPSTQLCNSGTDFFVAFGKNHQEATPANVELKLRVSALAEAKVNLSFTENNSLDTTFTVPSGTIFDYTLTAAQEIAAYSAKLDTNKKSIHVTSDEQITLVVMNAANHSVEASFVWPVESWGKEYYNHGISPYYNSPTDINNCNGFLLIAKEDSTTVTIQNPVISLNTKITLNAGGVYHYYYTNISSYGTHVVSDKPIGFFNSNTTGVITTGGVSMSNYDFEQLMPVSQWGKKFVAPTNDNDVKTGYFRIFAKDIPTNVTVQHSNSSTPISYTINASSPYNRHQDIIIDANNNWGSRGCYITSDNPVSICSFENPPTGGGSMSQPAMSWLPPIEQRAYEIFVSPLDFDGKYVFMKMDHYVTIIVPTASKDKTTISINGDAYQLVKNLSDFYWVADDVGGSGYSIGYYYFGASNVITSSNTFIHLNKNCIIYNPDGLMALAYGRGSYTNYRYVVGSRYRDLTAGFTVNDSNYIDVNWKNFCDVSSFTFKAYPDSIKNQIVWKINDEEKGSGDLTLNLPDGFYTVDMISTDRINTTHFYVGGNPIIWTPNAPNESDRYDWNNNANWTPAVVPTACNNVYIPGNSLYYPKLTTDAECNNIYFIQGAEMERPDILTYKKAHIQYNFGLAQTEQITGESDINYLIRSSSTSDRMLYSAANSAFPLDRERWYMLASPLKNIVSGDLGFGGFPLTFLKKFGPVNKDNQNYSVGNWTNTYNSMVEPLARNSTHGFAFFMYGAGNDTGDDAGCEEIGFYGQYNESDYLPQNRMGESYGILKTNGIIELPFFADSTALFAHRTQVYDPISQNSTFFYFGDGVSNPADLNMIFPKTEVFKRDSSNYRFTPDSLIDNTWVFQNPIYHPVDNLSDGNEFLVGNPYMSSINMIEFCKDNATSIDPEYKIWNGTTFVSFSVDTAASGITSSNALDNSLYVSPLQGFFLTYRGGDVRFDVTKISTARPATSSFNLRSAREEKEENILRIQSENKYAVSYALIGYKEKASNDFVRGEDVRKLFTPYNYVPEIYSLAGEIPVDINFIQNNGEVIVPLGVKTGQAGEIRLTFTGMDHYTKASKIEFIDALENKIINLTGIASYTYTFNQNETGIRNGRFSLRFDNTTTSLPEVNSPDNLKVYGDLNGIYVLSSESDPVKQVTVYDLHGRKLYESASGAKYYSLQRNPGASPLIIKVRTENQVKIVKIN